MKTKAALSLPLLLMALPADAEVASSTEAGFVVEHRVAIAAAPERVWAVMIEPARWWSAEHSYSGDAANCSLDGKAGGCFCEAVGPGGGVEHGRVVSLLPGRLLRIRGTLGPLQGDAVTGVLSFGLEPSNRGSSLTVRYVVGGYAPAGLSSLAGPVDRVIGEQVRRLAAAAGTAGGG